MAPRMGRGFLSSLVVVGLCFGQAQCRRLTAEEQQNAFLTQGSSSSKTYSPPPPPPADCSCSMYCNYCDSSHRDLFSMTGYSCNSTYDSTNLQRCTDDLYTEDELERSYETYMDYWCDLLYDTSTGKVKTVSGVTCSSSLNTYDSANLARCTEDLYTSDTVNRNYETYMDYWCTLLYNASTGTVKSVSGVTCSAELKAKIPTACARHYTCEAYCDDYVCPQTSPPPPPPSPPPPSSKLNYETYMDYWCTLLYNASTGGVKDVKGVTCSAELKAAIPVSCAPSPGSPPSGSPSPAGQCQCALYHSWYDAQHRYRLSLPHYPNNTYDVACNQYVEQDLYWDDDSNKCYEDYMDHWCDMVFPPGSNEVVRVPGMIMPGDMRKQIPISCNRHHMCKEECHQQPWTPTNMPPSPSCPDCHCKDCQSPGAVPSPSSSPVSSPVSSPPPQSSPTLSPQGSSPQGSSPQGSSPPPASWGSSPPPSPPPQGSSPPPASWGSSPPPSPLPQGSSPPPASWGSSPPPSPPPKGSSPPPASWGSSPPPSPPPTGSSPPPSPPPTGSSPPPSPPPPGSSPPPPPTSTPSPSPVPTPAPVCLPGQGSPDFAPGYGAFVGVALDFNKYPIIANYSQAAGWNPASYNLYVNFPLGDNDKGLLNYVLPQIAAINGMAFITVEPWGGLDSCTEQAAADLADLIHQYELLGLTVIIRFAQEMNGSWYPWGFDSCKFVEVWRYFVEIIRGRTCRTVFMWAPADGGGYPFAGGNYSVINGTTEWHALDTNDDGWVDMYDDPYTPFYPGDQWVDWVGMNMYHMGQTYPWGANALPEDRKLTQKIIGNYSGPGGDLTPVPDFYHMFAVEHNKPMAICETGAMFNTQADATVDAYHMKIKWLEQVFNVLGDTANAVDISQSFPMIKMVNWFDMEVTESDISGAIVDWRVTGCASNITQAFLGWLQTTCTGSSRAYWKTLGHFQNLMLAQYQWE
ncbi:hypothetical protein WJX82_003619 [Trebouxia sp. C0006]